MQREYEIFRNMLRQHGLSMTRQRRELFYLLKDSSHMTASTLIERAITTMDRASAYRTLAIFEELGIVQRINIGGWRYKLELSDKFEYHHHHLVCIHCHKIIGIDGNDLEGLVERVSRLHEFEPLDHQIEIQGLCRDCRKILKSNALHQRSGHARTA